jgi:hypothetical protein
MYNKYFGSNIVCATICIVSTIYWIYNENKLKRKIDVLYDNVYEVNEKCDKNKILLNICKEKVYTHHFPEPMFESSEEETQSVTMDCEE